MTGLFNANATRHHHRQLPDLQTALNDLAQKVQQQPDLTLGLGIGAAVLFCFVCIVCACSGCCRGCFRSFFPGFAGEEFQLLAHVSEVLYKGARKAKLRVRLAAGRDIALTPRASKGMFLQTLTLLVKSDTQKLLVEVLNESDVVLAVTKLDIQAEVLQSSGAEKVYTLRPKFRGLTSPSIRLSLKIADVVHDSEQDKVEAQASRWDHPMDSASTNAQRALDVEAESATNLKLCCSGPVEVFGTWGKTTPGYIGIDGSPLSQRFILGVWADEQEYESRLDGQKEIDILRIDSVEVDMQRLDVFIVSFLDHRGVRRTLRCRLLDRPAKVWVEMIHEVISRAREYGKVRKKGTSAAIKVPSGSDW